MLTRFRWTPMKTRAELDAELFQLRAALPLWRRALGSEGEFCAHCESLAAEILESTHPNDRAYAATHLHDALEHHKNIAHGFAGESCR